MNSLDSGMVGQLVAGTKTHSSVLSTESPYGLPLGITVERITRALRAALAQMKRSLAARAEAMIEKASDLIHLMVDASSLQSRGIRVHFDTAVALTSVIPMMGIGYVLMRDPVLPTRIGVVTCSLSMMVLGYAILSRYPRVLVQMRDYLRQVAAGEIPAQVKLSANESDLTAVAQYFRLVLDDLRNKITLIESQKGELVEAERKKAIMESLATTCHYLGQPATVITAGLGMMERMDIRPSNAKDMVRHCQEAATSMQEILYKLNSMTNFESEPYLSSSDEALILTALSKDS